MWHAWTPELVVPEAHLPNERLAEPIDRVACAVAVEKKALDVESRQEVSE